MIVPTTMVKSKRFHASGQGGREKAWACEALQTVHVDPRNTNLISARQLYTLFMMLPPPLGYCGVNPRPSLEAIGEYIGAMNGVCG